MGFFWQIYKKKNPELDEAFDYEEPDLDPDQEEVQNDCGQRCLAWLIIAYRLGKALVF